MQMWRHKHYIRCGRNSTTFFYTFVIISPTPFVSKVTLTIFILLSIHVGLEKYLTFHSVGTLEKKVATCCNFLRPYSIHYFHITGHPRVRVRVCVCACVCVWVTNRKIAEFKWPNLTEFDVTPTSPLSASCNWKFKHRAPAEFWAKISPHTAKILQPNRRNLCSNHESNDGRNSFMRF
jgi:hypothetical protein